MVLHQQSSEGCHVRISESSGRVSGVPWPYDEFDCLLVPSLCGLGCHFRLKSSEWNCLGTPPDVWILGVELTGTLSGEPSDRIEGTMEVDYDHRPGSYSAYGGGYAHLTVTTHFELTKVLR